LAESMVVKAIAQPLDNPALGRLFYAATEAGLGRRRIQVLSGIPLTTLHRMTDRGRPTRRRLGGTAPEFDTAEYLAWGELD
jgi:hypothetical protein